MTTQSAKDQAAKHSGFVDFDDCISTGSKRKINEVVDKALAIYSHTNK